MPKRLIIDCSVMWYRAWWRMKSPGYQAQSVLELEEFARNLAGDLYELIQRFQAEDVVFGIDSKEWRSEYYRQYFADRVHFWKHKKYPQSWVAMVNNSHYMVSYHEHTRVWSTRKLTQLQEQVLDLQDPETWILFPAGKTPEYILEAFPSTFKCVQDCPDWEGLRQIFPQYKGGRNANWQFETPYKEYKDSAKSLTLNLADTFGARAVMAEWAEFDDIARAYISENPEAETILVTTDRDMDQLMGLSSKLSIWSPGSGKNNPAKWVRLSKELAEFHLLCKLVGGDDSDKIPGCTIWEEREKGPKKAKVSYRVNTTYGPVSWETDSTPKDGKKTFTFCQSLMEEHKTLAGCNAYLKAHEVEHSYTRNVSLMHLGAAPGVVKAACSEALQNTRVGSKQYELTDYMLTDRQVLEKAEQASQARAQDIADGVYA